MREYKNKKNIKETVTMTNALGHQKKKSAHMLGSGFLSRASIEINTWVTLVKKEM